MYTVTKTYYDSPREDCGGYYSDDFEVPTAKEAYKFASHINRLDEPVGASVYLRSGKPRVWILSLNDRVIEKTQDYSKLIEKAKLYRDIYCFAKKNGLPADKLATMRATISYR